jgi:hypothetical protein
MYLLNFFLSSSIVSLIYIYTNSSSLEEISNSNGSENAMYSPDFLSLTDFSLWLPFYMNIDCSCLRKIKYLLLNLFTLFIPTFRYSLLLSSSCPLIDLLW